jgi:hypothetical protein
MRFRAFVSVTATAGTLLAGSVLPASAATAATAATAPRAAAAAVTPLASCDSPPDSPDATPENRDRFVSLWSPRVADKSWMRNYLDLATVPDDIQAEGFHAMGAEVQSWLDACLLDDMLQQTGQSPTVAKYNEYLAGLNVMIFGKAELQKLRHDLNSEPRNDAETLPVKKDQTAEALASMSSDLLSQSSLTSADQPEADVTAPQTSVSKDDTGSASGELKNLLTQTAIVPQSSTPKSVTPSVVPTGVPLIDAVLGIPLVPLILKAINELLQIVANIEQKLFTLPVVNVLASVFYRICAESPTMPLRCSILLPVGIPIPADVTGDNFPDVTGNLIPLVNLPSGDVGARFAVTRLFPNSGPLPAHVFAVYDTPIVNKRIEFGYDGRASTLARNTNTTFKLEHALTAITGDVQVSADVTSQDPGSVEALTFAIKSLVGGSAGVLPSEEDPVAGSVQMNPFPTSFGVGAHLTHSTSKDEDVFTVNSSTPTRVDAIVDQATTTTTPKSNRQFTATVDKLPTSVTVDVVHQGEKQSIDYSASAPIDLVRASDTAIGDTSHPGSYTQSVYEVHGVPTNVHVDLQGSQDITYTANAKIPEVSFSTKTLADNVLQQQITAQAHQVPKSIHVTNLTSAAEQKVGYTADDKLGDVQLGMYDKDEAGVETNLTATATGIPTQMQFTSTKATGAYDFTSNSGIDLIEATLTRNNGSVLPMPGQDHATVYKRGEQLGLDFRLSGFTSAHFDGHEDTNVSLGLTPGGQTFDAIADIDDSATGGMNVLATAHVGALPSTMAVTFDPDNGTADYSASSVIPLLTASFTDRDTQMFGNVKLTDLPKNIGLTFNTSGGTPEVTYDADSRLGSIEANYSEKPGGLGLHALISDLPQYMKIGGINPIVFDARTAAGDPAGSSYLGQVFFQYATDGVFASPPTTDDHIYLDTDTVDSTHAELQYTGLQLLTVNTANQELHAEIRNTAARLLRAYLTTPSVSLTGFIDKVPADIKVDQVGNLVSYDASSPISQIYTNLDRSNGDNLAVDIHGVPQQIDLLFDGGNSKLQWDASAATTSVSAVAHLTPSTIGGTRAFDASLAIGSIPTHWDASWANGNVLFQAPAPGIGSIDARVTNHGAYHVLSGDHLSAFFDQTAGSSPGNLDASLHISNLTKAGFSKITNATGGGFQADLNMGNHSAFKFAGDVTLASTKLLASGQFTNLPAQISLKSDSGRITYTGDTNPDLTLSVKAGTPAAVAALPSIPTPHGVAIRDAASGGGKAYGANVFLTGLPTGLDLNTPAGTYEVTGYHPTNSTLHVDAILTTLASQPLSLQLQQVVPTASPVNFKFGPFLSSTDGSGNHTLSLSYTANQDLGALTAEATYGNTDDAKLEISSIPKSINVNAAFGEVQKTVGIAMSSDISDITASYKKVGALNFAASVHLHDVPSAVNIAIGRDSASGGGKDVTTPDFTMTASHAGLDIDAAASAEITDPVNANAAASLIVDNMGSRVTGQLDGTTLQVGSTTADGSAPEPTQKFLLSAAGAVNLDVDLAFDAGPFVNTGNLNVNVDLRQLTLGFTDASSLQLDLGITTGLKGNYATFTFGEDSETVINVHDKLRLVIGTPLGDVDWTIFNLDPTTINLHNVIDHFRLASNRLGDLFRATIIEALVGHCDIVVKIRPHAEFSTSGSSFTLGQPPSDSNPAAWLIAPDPNLLGFSLPDFVLDIIMYFTSPYGHDIDGGLECDLGP